MISSFQDGGTDEHLSHPWRRKKEVTWLTPPGFATMVKSIPAEAKTDASMVRTSPLTSMVPLERDENLGEVVWPSGDNHYPVWKIALIRLRRPFGVERKTPKTAITFVQP